MQFSLQSSSLRCPHSLYVACQQHILPRDSVDPPSRQQSMYKFAVLHVLVQVGQGSLRVPHPVAARPRLLQSVQGLLLSLMDSIWETYYNLPGFKCPTGASVSCVTKIFNRIGKSHGQDLMTPPKSVKSGKSPCHSLEGGLQATRSFFCLGGLHLGRHLLLAIARKQAAIPSLAATHCSSSPPDGCGAALQAPARLEQRLQGRSQRQQMLPPARRG